MEYAVFHKKKHAAIPLLQRDMIKAGLFRMAVIPFPCSLDCIYRQAAQQQNLLTDNRYIFILVETLYESNCVLKDSIRQMMPLYEPIHVGFIPYSLQSVLCQKNSCSILYHFFTSKTCLIRKLVYNFVTQYP